MPSNLNLTTLKMPEGMNGDVEGLNEEPMSDDTPEAEDDADARRKALRGAGAFTTLEGLQEQTEEAMRRAARELGKNAGPEDAEE